MENKGKCKWDFIAQAVFDCIIAGLRGLKNSGWLTLNEHEEIIHLLQKRIDEKYQQSQSQ